MLMKLRFAGTSFIATVAVYVFVVYSSTHHLPSGVCNRWHSVYARCYFFARTAIATIRARQVDLNQPFPALEERFLDRNWLFDQHEKSMTNEVDRECEDAYTDMHKQNVTDAHAHQGEVAAKSDDHSSCNWSCEATSSKLNRITYLTFFSLSLSMMDYNHSWVNKRMPSRSATTMV